MRDHDFSCPSLALRPYEERTFGSREPGSILRRAVMRFPPNRSSKVEFSGLNLRVSQSRVSF
jgi:hypothetical protein